MQFCIKWTTAGKVELYVDFSTLSMNGLSINNDFFRNSPTLCQKFLKKNTYCLLPNLLKCCRVYTTNTDSALS